MLRRAVVLVALVQLCAGSFQGCSNAVDAPAIQPTLTSIQQNIFDKSCTTSTCHSSFGNAGGLVLASGESYANLYNAESINDTAHAHKLLRVNPGKPDSSFLLIKLTGPGLGEGFQMPDKLGAISADQINAVRQWIANGANNN